MPLGRVLVLTKADATLEAEGRLYPLFTNRWASGAVAPQGHLLLESFHLDGTVPVWRFRCDGRVVEHRIWMEAGADTVYTAWRLDDSDAAPAELRVTLLANARDHHGESWPAGFAPELRAEDAALRVAVPGRFTLAIRASGGSIASAAGWYKDFDLPVERERGLPARDSHRHVGDLRLTLRPGTTGGPCRRPLFGVPARHCRTGLGPSRSSRYRRRAGAPPGP